MRWISVSFLARLDALGEGLRGQPELQQDDSMADVQGGRAEGCGRICVPRQLNESQHQQPGSEEWILPISRSAALGLLRPWTHPPSPSRAIVFGVGEEFPSLCSPSQVVRAST